MSRHVIAVCDKNEKYAMGISSLLMNKIDEQYAVLTFTCPQKLDEYGKENKIETLLITESAYRENLGQTSPEKLIILRETPDFVPEGAVLIDRFQSREEILRSVIEVLPECEEVHSVSRLKIHHWKVIGVYSPVRRCLQTSFAMTLGQTLGRSHRVLYMNFENYSGLSGMLNREFESDIVDLLYFFDCDRDKLARRLALTVHDLNGMDILPPAASYLDTYERTGDRWIEFFEAIEQAGDYEYLILDLTDAMQGLLQVLGYCERIYTLTRNDPTSRAKLSQYEDWMALHSDADVMSKTLKFSMPEFGDIPSVPELMTKGELAAYVRAIIREDNLEEAV